MFKVWGLGSLEGTLFVSISLYLSQPPVGKKITMIIITVVIRDPSPKQKNENAR